ncbi:MAG: DUF1631 family protein [Rhodocyclaceae bacterium]|nr:DUF1631 family protein [Rhodocyclaceae bacterium]
MRRPRSYVSITRKPIETNGVPALNAVTESTYPALLASCRKQFLDVLEAFARDRGFVRRDELAGLADEAGLAFDELAGLKGHRGFEAAQGLTSSRISLLQEADLEFSIVLNDVARRARDRCEGELARVHACLMRVLGRRDSSSEQCPIGPEAACRGLRGLAEAAGLDPELRLRLLSNNADELAHCLHALYRRLMQQFKDAGFAELAAATRQPSSRREAAAGAAQVGGAIASLHRSMLPADAASAGGQAVPPDLLRLIGQWIDEHCGAGEPFAGSRLASLLSPRRAAAVVTVERLFDALAVEPSLAAGLRAALGHLRVPLLKLALESDALFSSAEHPANRLAQAMAAACAGIEAGTTDESPWLSRVDATARALSQPTGEPAQAMRQALGATEALIDERLQNMRDAARVAADAALRSERHDACLAGASRALRAMIEARTPDAVVDFLELYWIQVLARTAYAKGDRSTEYESLLRTAVELVDSVRPVADGQRLRSRLPELIRRLQGGIELLGLEPRRRTAALAPCMDLHSAMVCNAPPPAYRRARPVGLRLRPVPDIEHARLLMHGGHSPRDAVAPKWLQSVDVGEWLFLQGDEIGRWHGCVGWVGPMRQLLTLVGTDGVSLLLVSLRALSEMAESGNAHLLKIPSPLDVVARQLVATGTPGRKA